MNSGRDAATKGMSGGKLLTSSSSEEVDSEVGRIEAGIALVVAPQEQSTSSCMGEWVMR